MKNYWFIGDIHGEIALLEGLLAAIMKYRPERITFLGDYIDRGPYSREVVDCIMGLEVPAACLMGNHELMMLAALEDLAFGNNAMELWYYNGAEATLQSFGFSGFYSFQSQMETRYLDFFRRLLMSHVTLVGQGKKILATHAGVSPVIPVADQLLLKDYRDLQQYMLNRQVTLGDTFLWSRESFFNSHARLWEGYLVVHGHTPTAVLKRYVQQGNHSRFHFVGDDLVLRRHEERDEVISVGIDSGSVYSGRLSGLGIFTDPQDHAQNSPRMRSITVTREDVFPRDLGPIGP
jgi:serine/threonine protein phosphatase 1